MCTYRICRKGCLINQYGLINQYVFKIARYPDPVIQYNLIVHKVDQIWKQNIRVVPDIRLPDINPVSLPYLEGFTSSPLVIPVLPLIYTTLFDYSGEGRILFTLLLPKTPKSYFVSERVIRDTVYFFPRYTQPEPLHGRQEAPPWSTPGRL